MRNLGIFVRGLWFMYLHTYILYIKWILFIIHELAQGENREALELTDYHREES